MLPQHPRQSSAPNSACPDGQIIFRSPPVSRPIKRGVSRSSRTLGAGCDGRCGITRRVMPSRRRSRVVLMPRRWHHARGRCFRIARDGDKKPDHQGERGISRHTIAQGMPDCCGVPVVTNSCVLFFTHEAAGPVHVHPAFPVPSALRGTRRCKHSGAKRAAGVRKCG